MEFDKLHNRNAFESQRQALVALNSAEKEIDRRGAQAIDQIAEAANFADYKSEYQALKNVGLCFEGPIRYKRFRESGQSPSSMCRPRSNLAWIMKQLGDGKLKEQLTELEHEREQQKAAYETATAALNTISIRSLKKNS